MSEKQTVKSLELRIIELENQIKSSKLENAKSNDFISNQEQLFLSSLEKLTQDYIGYQQELSNTSIRLFFLHPIVIIATLVIISITLVLGVEFITAPLEARQSGLWFSVSGTIVFAFTLTVVLTVGTKEIVDSIKVYVEKENKMILTGIWERISNEQEKKFEKMRNEQDTKLAEERKAREAAQLEERKAREAAQLEERKAREAANLALINEIKQLSKINS
jgi:hypothetical protein